MYETVIQTTMLDILIFTCLSFLFIWIVSTLSTKVFSDWWNRDQPQYPNIEDVQFFPQFIYKIYKSFKQFFFFKKGNGKETKKNEKQKNKKN